MFKTPEEIAANTFDSRGLVAEVKDPRKEATRYLKSPREQVKDYGYSSELTPKEQISIIRSLKSSTLYNSSIAKIQQILTCGNAKVSKEVDEKWKKEQAHFNKCAEIYYHRHITELNNLISDDVKNFLLKRWNRLECSLSGWKYQVITMLLRQKTWNKTAEMSVEFDNENSQEFSKEFYIVPQSFFPHLHRFSIERLKLYEQNKKFIDDESEADIKISLAALTKLFVDGDEFSIGFENSESGTKFLNNEVVPSKFVNPVEALEEVVTKIFVTDVEWLNIDRKLEKDLADNVNSKVATNPLLQAIKSDSNFIHDCDNFQAQKVDEIMKNIYNKFKKDNGQNLSSSTWKIKRNQQELKLSIQRHTFCLDQDTSVNLSFKLEFQTNFGAEKMTKEELLKEWITHKLSIQSKTLRYRVDAKTLQILSITEISIEDIERDLREIYDFDPLDALELLFNTFNTIKNLPHGNYLIQAKIGTLHIYKSSEKGKEIFTTEDIKISPTFSRKWIPIDEKFPTYIHMNLKIAPCCFPTSFGRHKKATSYKLPVKKQIKPTAQSNVPTTSAILKKKKTWQKRSKRKIIKTKKFGD